MIDEDIFEGMRAGAVGYLLKDVSSEKLFEAIHATFRGEYFMLPSITAKSWPNFPGYLDQRPDRKQH